MAIVRARYADTVLDPNGNVIPTATVTARQPGTTTPITESMYGSTTTPTALPNPFPVDGYGRFAFYMDEPARVDLYVYAPGRIAYTLSNVDVTRAADAAYFIAAANASAQSKALAWRVCTGVADNVDIQAGIDAVYALGGGEIELSEGLFSLVATVTLKDGVTLKGKGSDATTLRWAGLAVNNVVSSSVVSPLTGAQLKGMTVDANSVATVTPLFLNSSRWCVLDDVILANTGAGAPALRIEATIFSENAAFNTFINVEIRVAGTGLQFNGVDGSQCVTNNYFYNLRLRQITIVGIRLADWTDNNYFYGTHIGLTGNGAYGLVFNDSTTPGGDVGVYGNQFYGLSVDSFGIAGATGILFNKSKQNAVWGFFHSPEVFSGTLINDNAGRADSYYIVNLQQNLAANGIEILTKGVVSERGGAAAAVVDGGTIAHGLSATPNHAVATASVAGEFVSITAKSATTLTVAIKTHTGGVGTQQTIYWRAWV